MRNVYTLRSPGSDLTRNGSDLTRNPGPLGRDPLRVGTTRNSGSVISDPEKDHHDPELFCLLQLYGRYVLMIRTVRMAFVIATVSVSAHLDGEKTIIRNA